MRSLKGRLLAGIVAMLTIAALLLIAALVARDRSSAGADAVTLAESASRTAAAFTVAEIKTLADHEVVAHRIAQASSKSLGNASVVIFGRTAKVLGAVPSKSVKVEYTVDPDCRNCHLAGVARNFSAIDRRGDDELVARAISPINAEVSCKQAGCHPSAAKPLGYAYVQLPVAHMTGGARSTLFYYIAAVLVLLAALGYAALRYAISGVLTPTVDVMTYIRGVAAGSHSAKPMYELPQEMEGAFDGLEHAAKRLDDLEVKVPQLLGSCTTSAMVLHRMAGLLARNTDTEREHLWQLEKSLAKLASDIKDVNGSVDLIVASADDNSGSLGEMTGSVKMVASDAEQLSLHVKRSVGSVQQMCRSVQAVADHVELLVARVDAAAGRVGYIESSANDIANNAREASDLSGEMAGSASVGAQAVQTISDSIKVSYKEILVAADSMRELKKASHRVGDILKIINEINDKTKLLALNAAIIAAQAGEQGRSFAVVAHEIKGLSDRTAMSTGDIARIIEAIQEGVDRALGNVSRGEERLGSSVEAVGQAGTLLSGIAETSSDMYTRIRNIGDAAKRQTLLSNEVSESVAQVAGMVDEIKRRVKEHSASAETVEASSQAMSGLTDQVRSAAKEQADTSRYLSEAFTIIDVHLKGVLKSFGANSDIIGEVINGVSKGKTRLDDSNKAIADAEAALTDLDRNFAQLAALVSDRTDGD